MKTLGQMVRWGVSAVGGLIANLLLLTLWVDHIGLHPAVAIFPNFVLISTVSYLVTNHWVFPDGVSPSSLPAHIRQYVGTEAAMLAGKAANYVIYIVLIPVTDYRIAWVIGAVATFLITFGINKWWWSERVKSPSSG